MAHPTHCTMSPSLLGGINTSFNAYNTHHSNLNWDASNNNNDNNVRIQLPPPYKDTANKKKNDQPLLFKASIFRAQGHVYKGNHCWDDREVVGI